MALTNLSNKKGNTILKPLYGDTISNDSCSSTICDYKSKSDRQSLSRLVEQGSQINRYYDKYISLMDSKLLDKCIRTRALYDALRSQLLSSSISISSEADVKQRQSPTEKPKALEEDNKSNDMLASVNLVDKGDVLVSRKLNECCSCCNCNSKAGLHENVQKGRRNRQGHAGGYITSKSSVNSKQGASKELRLGKKFKAKNIKSDPCACAFKLKELIRLQSRVIFKKIRPEQPINERDRLLKSVDKHKLMRFNNEKVRKSYHKVKRSKAHPTQYTENMGEGGIKTIPKLKQTQDSSDVEKKKSIEQLKLAQQKIIDSFNDDRKAIQKSKPADGSTVTNITIRLKDRVSDNRQLQNWEFKQRTPRKPGNLLKSISRSSIEKSSPIDNKANKNKLKQIPSVSRHNKINLLDAPLFYAPRTLQLSIKPRSHEGTNKQKHMMQKIRAGSHALNRCLCSLTIKVKKNKSKITKTGTREMAKIKENVSKCECSDYITNTEKQETPKKQRNKYRPGQTNTYPDTKSVSNYTFKCECPLTNVTTKEKESLSECECVNIITNSSKEKGGPKYKPSQINTHFPLKFTSTRASDKTKEKREVQNDSVQTVNNNTTKDKLGNKTDPAMADNQRETKSILNHVSKCKCPLTNVTTKEKEKLPECECRNITTNSSKDKGGSKYKSSQTIIHSRLKSTLTRASDKTKEIRKVQNDFVQTVNNNTTKEKLGIKTYPAIADNQRETTSVLNHVSKCECPITNFTTKEKENLSECECLNIITNISKEKGGSKYKSSQTNIHSGLKSTSTRASDKTKEKRRVQNHSVQTVNNVTTKENLGIKTYPAITDNQRKTKSISNHVSKCKCPFTNVTTKEKEELSSKQRENNKTQTGFKPRFHRPKHIKNKQSQISSSTGKSKYTTRKHGLSRCLCTLKLRKLEKKNKNSRKLSKQTGSPSVSTTKDPQTKRNVKNVSISTQSGERRQIQEKHLILPFDCGFCDPGVCNPRECKVVLTKRQSTCICVIGKKKYNKHDTYKYLEKMKKRNVRHSRDIGIVTQRTKMVSNSSDIRELGSASNPLFVKSDFKQRNSSLEKFRNLRNYSELSHLPKNAREMYSEESLEQGISIGSTFSFNIEFYKDITPENNIISRRSKKNSAHLLKNKQYVEQLANRSNDTQKFRLKTTRVRPILNKCFCTLQLLKKEEQRPGCKLITPFVIKKPTQVYALSPVAKTKINSPEILLLNEDNLGPHCAGSYDPTSYTNKALSNTKQWKYFKNNSLSSFISISTIAFKSKKIQSYIHESKCTLLKISPTNQSLLDFTSKETVRFESKFSYEINYLKNIQPNIQRNVKSAHSKIYSYAQRQCKKHNLEIQEKIRDLKLIEDITNPSQLTGIQPLLRRCYCTMNTQLQNSSKKRNRNLTKLKDYECEPGVCIPYECDPYECQKMIMKRLAKKVSRLSGAEKRLRNSSSMASSISSSSRTQKMQTNLTREHKHHKTRPSGIKYQTLPQTFGKQRQAVRVSSSFNFDIEFSKGSAKSAPAGYIKRSSTTRSSKTYNRHRKDRGTRGFRGGRRDRDSQSMTQQMRHRASSVTPMLKRCFCTLKLQKKGRQHKERQLQTLHQGTSTNQKTTKLTYEYPADASSELITKGRGMQTKEYIQSRNIRSRPRERTPVLEPYECEPGVCVPGLCDPYECEKLIRKRRAKEKMTNTSGPKTKSTSSSPTSSKTSKSSSMGHSTLSRPHEKVRRRDHSLREMVTREKPRPSVLPPRQAVRIGSKFSFNIEFYKDKGLNSNYEQGQTSATTIKKYRPTRDHAHRARDQAHRARDQAHRPSDQAHRARYGTNMRDRGVSERCSPLCSKICQSCPAKKNDKALGPILKRCFCTLKLHKRKQDIKSIEKEKPLQMCDTGCTAEFDITEEQTLQTRSMMTVNKYKVLPYKLEPYECEPGVCMPGECDPYECEKLIKKRLMNKSSGTLTDRYRTRSTSNTIRHRRRHQDSGAQPAMQYKKRMRTRDIRRKLRSTGVKEPINQGVKIGSNFSFNLEFYKDSSPGSSVASSRSIEKNDAYKKPRSTVSKSTERRSIAPRYKRGQYRNKMRNKDSQVFSRKMQSTTTGVGPFLKRCFCTLQLQKPAINKKEIKSTKKSTQCDCAINNKEEIKPVAREIGTLTKKYTHALEPYECEPGVCVPGQCDPYECEKRIKLRNMKNFGTRTTGASMKSMSNMTSKGRRTKGMRTNLLIDRGDKMRKTSTDTIYRVKKLPPSSLAVENINRQAAHLGSSFSFNVEFFKDKSSDQGGYQGGSNYDETRNNYRPRAKYKTRASFLTAKRKHRGSHGRDRLLYHRNSQVGAQTESRGSGMAPILKRCFCTLTLQRAEVKNTLNTIPTCVCKVKKNTINCSCKEQNTSKSKVKNKLKNCTCGPTTQDKRVSTENKYFEPDECEPGICMPGECNPYECLERIKKKGIRRVSRTIGTRTKPPSEVSYSSMAPPRRTLFASKRTKFKEGYLQQNVERIVEEPRFPFLTGSSQRQGVRISSNFSFDIEFFREDLPDLMRDEKIRKKDLTVFKKIGLSKLKSSIVHPSTKNNGLQSEQSQTEHVQTDEKSSAVGILKRCFCTMKLHKSNLSNHPQAHTCICRMEEIRPITGLGLFGPKEYWVQYQKQQPVETNKSLKMESNTTNNRRKDSYELENIMSYTPNKFSKNYGIHFGKTSRSNCHCKFCRKHGPVGSINLTKGKKFIKSAQQTPEAVEDNPSTLKKMLCLCKHLFTKRISQLQSNKNIEKEDFKRKAIKQPRTEVLKTSKSERHPNNAATAGIKTSKSLKVARVSGKDDNTKKYSRFQSGDAEQGYNFTNKPQNTGIYFVKKNCLHCQAQVKQAISINKQVHFVLYHKDEALKPKNVKVTESKKESKSVTFLFKNSKFKKEDVKCFKLNSCCGSIKRKINLSCYGHGLDSKKTILNHGEDTTKLIPKQITVLPKENKKKDKQSYSCCVGRTNKNVAKVTNKVKKIQPCRSMAYKEEAIKLATNSGLEVRRTKKMKCVCGTKTYAAESVKEALSEESEFKRARGKKKTEIGLEQEAKIRGKNYIEEDGVIKRRKINDSYMMKMKKLKKYKDIPDVTLVAESVFNSKRTYRNLKMYLRYPMRALKKFQNVANDGFRVALLKRLKLRCLAMTCVEKGQETLEEHPVTNFLRQSIDRNLKRRIHPKKPSLWRHPDTSFGCNPLMLSLRKRPWLSVYHKCSWFYPPCLRLLLVWRQSMDILLFLLAVAVLSPCIVSMELYRAMMCCFLCTG